MALTKNYPRNFLVSQLNKPAVLGVPDSHFVVLSYPVNTTWTATAYEATYQFALNDLFDPDYTGAGGQPTYFDQWAVLYSRYRVLGCRVDLTFDNSTSSSIRVAAVATANTSLLTSLSWSGIAGTRNAVLAKTLTDRSVTMKYDWWVDMVAGVSLQSVYNEANYAGAVTGSPSTRQLLSFVAGTGGATDAVRVFGIIKFVARLEAAQAPNISLGSRATRGPPARAAADAFAGTGDAKAVTVTVAPCERSGCCCGRVGSF